MNGFIFPSHSFCTSQKLSEPSISEENEIKHVAMQMDPELTPSQASVMTAILKEVSTNANVETIQEVSSIVKEDNKLSAEVIDTLSMLIEPLTNEVTVDEIEMVKKVTKSMENQPSMAAACRQSSRTAIREHLVRRLSCSWLRVTLQAARRSKVA